MRKVKNTSLLPIIVLLLSILSVCKINNYKNNANANVPF